MATNVHPAYNLWAGSYDDIENKTRDLDKKATQRVLADIIQSSPHVLEFGCGTGKNTEWLLKNASRVTAVDFSEEMLNKAKEKLEATNLHFMQADITQPWPYQNESFDLITCNLILEHVKDIEFVFAEASRVLHVNGYFFISELHPFKQYLGSKAHFEKNNQLIVPDCYTHHISEFFSAASKNNFTCCDLKEWFDHDDSSQPPRLISFLFRKQTASPKFIGSNV